MSDQSGAKGGSGLLRWSLWGVGLAGVAAVVYIIMASSSQTVATGGDEKPARPGVATSLKSLAKGEMAKLEVPASPILAPEYGFIDAEGKPVRLADFKGKVVVMNLWATWCAPCVTEMPTLARLAKAYEGKPLKVVAVSVDADSGVDKAKAFIAMNGPLAFYSDPKTRMPFALLPPAPGMPTTVIYGKDGVERARLAGGADWSGPAATAVIDAILAEG
jgi:thiol-disulfide isomerase/thioredoxin